MGDRSGMPISADSPSDETLNQGPLALILHRQYEFPFGINIVQILIFKFMFLLIMGVEATYQKQTNKQKTNAFLFFPSLLNLFFKALFYFIRL